MHRSAVLIGLPTSGKSTLGRLAAARLNMAFCDTDDLLAARVGMPLEAFLHTHGPTRFTEEEEAVCATLHLKTPTLVATGGSVVYSAKGMANLARQGRIIYLHMTPSELQRRLAVAPSRALLVPPGESWDDVVAQRMNLYARYAQATVMCEGPQVESALPQLLDILEKSL